uniref:Uncharacterized protein n=1 Tax=Astatotilapia calliptera TaxID=8154 RepID=A0A3P8NIM8_ASTCA
MFAASNLRSEDQFLCSVCLDVFADPVTTPCGHNFCKKCITQHWDRNAPCQCPMCKEAFYCRPLLKVNTLFSEVVLKQASRSEDHLHFVQNFSSLKAVPPTKDWTEVIVLPPTYEGTVMRAVAQLEETLRIEMKKLFEAELRRLQQYAVDVSLDADTAHPELILSDDGKQVNHGDEKHNLPDNPERFSYCVCVLGKQSFSSGRFYYEAQVKRKTDWELGVARESIDRKKIMTLSPEDGFWTVVLRNGNEYKALDEHDVCVCRPSGPEKVGVFVDYEEGVVSFYDIDAAALIYSFTGCSFTEKLYPYFNPCNNDNGKNSAPLLIPPINHIE